MSEETKGKIAYVVLFAICELVIILPLLLEKINAEKENERLQNIMNKLEKFIIERANLDNDNTYLDKIKELKGE